MPRAHPFWALVLAVVWCAALVGLYAYAVAGRGPSRRKRQRSWDFYGTLMNRRCSEDAVFQAVEDKYGPPGFAVARKRAQAGRRRTIAEIYNDMPEGMRDRLAQEMRLELASLYPIVESCNRLRPGDWIVSDGPYPPEALRGFLQAFGIDTRELKIVSTPAGKRDGWIWSAIGLRGGLHTGDNPWTDGVRAWLGGQRPRLYLSAQPTWSERLMGSQAGEALTETRLANPYAPGSEEHRVWSCEQCQFNLPLLVCSSIVLHNSIKAWGVTRVLFATRDCCIWAGVYAALYPAEADTLVYFDCSRRVFRQPPEQYLEYVERLLPHDGSAVFVDISGSGRSFRRFFRRWPVARRPAYFAIGSYVESPLLPRTGYVLWPWPFGVRLEVLNYDTVGSLVGYGDGGAHRGPCEYPLNLVRVAHAAADLFLAKIQPCSGTEDVRLARHRAHIILGATVMLIPIEQRYHVGAHQNNNVGETSK